MYGSSPAARQWNGRRSDVDIFVLRDRNCFTFPRRWRRRLASWLNICATRRQGRRRAGAGLPTTAPCHDKWWRRRRRVRDPTAERFQIASGRTASSSRPAEQMLPSFVAETSAVELMHFPSSVTAHVTGLYSDLAGYKLCHLSEHTS